MFAYQLKANKGVVFKLVCGGRTRTGCMYMFRPMRGRETETERESERESESERASERERETERERESWSILRPVRDRER